MLVPDPFWAPFNLIEVVLCTIVGIVILVKAWPAYLQKRNKLSQIVIIALMNMTLTMAASIFQFANNLTFIDGSIPQLMAYFFTMAMSYGWFNFSRIVFLGEHNHTMVEKLALFMATGTIIFGILRFFFGQTNPFIIAFYFLRFAWLLAYEGLIIVVILGGSIQMRGRIPKQDPHRSKINNIIIMAIAYAVSAVLYIFDTLLTMQTNLAGNWAYAIATIAVFFFLIITYRTFFTKPKSILN